MKKNTLRLLAIPAALALLCAVPASAQFDNYVALGDSLTAGVEGNCLVQRNQVASFPAVIAQQLGISDFQQPLVQELALTSPLVGAPCLGVVFSNNTVGVGAVSQMGQPLNSQLARPYNNLGIPGANVPDLIDLRHGNPNGDTADRFSVLVLRNVPGSPFDGFNAVEEANLLAPDLVTLWAGSNDVLTAMLVGVAIPGVTITPLAVFQAKYNEVLASQAVLGRTIVAANVPDVTSVPFATTVPAAIAIPGGSVPVLGPGNAEYPCVPVAPDQGCPVPAGTLVTLPGLTLLRQGIGVPTALGGTGLPLPDGGFTPPATLNAGVLIYPNELAIINAYIHDYNTTIAADMAGLGPVVDMNALLAEIRDHGYHIGGITLTTSFITGGLFSADGFHPSSIGYMIIADEFIRVMNEDLALAIPRPSFNEVLFTPNCFPGSFGCPPAGASVRGGDPEDYSFAMWSDLLRATGAAKGLTVKLPEVANLAARPTRGAGPRALARD